MYINVHVCCLLVIFLNCHIENIFKTVLLNSLAMNLSGQFVNCALLYGVFLEKHN